MKLIIFVVGAALGGGIAWLCGFRKRYIAGAIAIASIVKLISFLKRAYPLFFVPSPSSYNEMSIRNEEGTLYDIRGEQNKPIIYAFLPFRINERVIKVSPRCLIFFHGNAEDIGNIMWMLKKFRDSLQCNIIAVEYPGFGMTYQTRKPTPDVIKSDAERIYAFVNEQLQFEHRNILVVGRSIGSGAASHLASANQNVCNLVLQSPIASIRKIAADKVPIVRLIDIENFFDNEACLTQTKARVQIFHGTNDEVVPIEHSRCLARAYARKQERLADLRIIDQMRHNNVGQYLNSHLIPAIQQFMRDTWAPVNARTIRPLQPIKEKMDAQ